MGSESVFSFTDYNASSRALYGLEAREVSGELQFVMLDFFLPPTLLEIQGNAESGPFLTKPLTAKVSAFLAGRGYVVPQDVKDMALDVLRHRVIVTYEAEAEEKTSEDVVRTLLDHVPVP